MQEPKKFKKTAKQVEACKLLAKPAKHTMLEGGSRSAKTFTLVRHIFIRAAKRKSRHVILRAAFTDVKTSVWLDTIPKVLELCFPNLNPHPNKSDYFYTLANGSEIWIAGLDNKLRLEKILGKEYSTIYFNECSTITREARDLVMTRLAENSGLVNKFYYDQNPPAKKHWTYWLFHKLWDSEGEKEVDPNNYVHLRMNPRDNLENLPEDYIELLKSMPEKMRKRFLDGEYGENDDGEAYYEFDRDRHVANAIKMAGSIYVGMDFNVDPMTAVVFQCVNNEFHVIDEIFLRNSDTYKMCSELNKRGFKGASIIPDSTAKNRKTSGKSDINILKENGFNILATHNPLVRDRINNTNRLLAANRIKINPKCKKLINDFEKVSWVNDKLDQKTDPLLTHISDAFTYGLWKLDPISYKSTPIHTRTR